MIIPADKFHNPGLIRTHKPETPVIESSQRAALIRRGNELFSTGDIEQAKKIFMTTHYTDGLVRVGDYYYKSNDFLSALRMYIIAPDDRKKNGMIKSMAHVIREWLKN